MSKFNGRTGDIIPQAGDYTAAMVGAATPDDVNAVSDIATAAQTTANTIKQTLEKNSIPSKSVTVEMADLSKYINSLPRLLTEALTIEVPGGKSEAMIEASIRNFYGPGSLTLKSRENEQAVIKYLGINNNAVPITVENITVSVPSTAGSLFSASSSYVKVVNCSVIGEYDTALGNNTQIGIMANNNTTLFMSDCKLTKLYRAVNVDNSRVSTYNCGGEENNIGFACFYGGIIALDGSTPELIGGKTNIRKNGSIIIKNDGTLLT